MSEKPIEPDFKIVGVPAVTFEGHAYEAYCVDCPETFSGTLEECHDWLNEHRKETGHKG